MFKIIKATQFRRNARSVIDDVDDAQTTYIVTRYGKPQAVVLVTIRPKEITGQHAVHPRA